MQAAEIIVVPQMLDTVKTELQKERRAEIRERKFQNKISKERQHLKTLLNQERETEYYKDL